MDSLANILSTLKHLDLKADIEQLKAIQSRFGSTCDVFMGWSKNLKKNVAVKRIRLFLQEDENFAKKLAKEIRIWASLEHECILPFLGYFAEGEGLMPSLISLWMGNGTVDEYMKKFSRGGEETRVMLCGIADGLSYLHSQEVIHADLKSKNVLISDDGKPLLTDFGLSTCLSFTKSTTTASSTGTVRWMAIEFFDNVFSGPTAASDVWSFGMVVYELLSGNIPYCNRPDHVIPSLISNKILPDEPASESQSMLFNQLWALCRNCWKKTPKGRPTAAKLYEVLSRTLVSTLTPTTHIHVQETKTHFTLVLNQLEHLPGLMALTQLIHPPAYSEQPQEAPLEPNANFVIDALRLIELSDRTSTVMKSSDADELIETDPLLAVFKTFGELNDLPITCSSCVVTFDDFSMKVADHARENHSHLILLPCLPPSIALSHPNANTSHPANPAASTAFHNPFDMSFKSTPVDKSVSLVHSQFIRGVFKQSSTDVALYVDRFDKGARSVNTLGRHGKQHILLPFFGGPDDRLALDFVIQLCANPKIAATVVRVSKADTAYADELFYHPSAAHTKGVGDQEAETSAVNIKASGVPLTTITGHPDTIYGNFNTQNMMQSETADNIVWSRYASPSASNSPSPQVADALTRITFAEVSTPSPLHTVIDQATMHVSDTTEKQERKLTVVLGRSRRLAVENHSKELKEIMEVHGGVGREIKKTIGDVATALVVSRCKLALVVMQAADRLLE